MSFKLILELQTMVETYVNYKTQWCHSAITENHDNKCIQK